MKQIRDYFLIFIGVLSFALGTIGIVLPVLPTTPFYLLTFACLGVCPKTRDHFMKYTFFANTINTYQQRNGFSKKRLAQILISMWLVMGLSMWIVSKLWLTILLVIIGICVSIHIIYISKPRVKKDKKTKQYE